MLRCAKRTTIAIHRPNKIHGRDFKPTPLGLENSPQDGNLRRACTTEETRENSRLLAVGIGRTQFIARGNTSNDTIRRELNAKNDKLEILN